MTCRLLFGQRIREVPIIFGGFPENTVRFPLSFKLPISHRSQFVIVSETFFMISCFLERFIGIATSLGFTFSIFAGSTGVIFVFFPVCLGTFL